MPNIIRHDSITLHAGIKEEDFEHFMIDELFRFFSVHYRGPTRASRADLKGQLLLRGSYDRRQYLWVTSWDGVPESVAGAAFENARMTPVKDVTAILNKLDSFGSRAAEALFDEVSRVDVATNL